MPSVEDDITNHLHMCVALMSDPLTMRDRPGIVADHFMAAMGKIERLQVLLAMPADHCAKNNWLGSSILNSGVRQMVGLVLAKHMEPLRWKHPKHALRMMSSDEGQRNAAPRIFALKFEQGGHKPCHETDLAREIKENNCMASLVLLYYYLHWHLLLILLNFRLHPCVDGREVESRLDVDRLLKALPAFFDTFELRPLRSHLNRDYSKTDEGDDLSDCSSDGDNREVDSEEEDVEQDNAAVGGGGEGVPPRRVENQSAPEGGVGEGRNSKQRKIAEMNRIQVAVRRIMQNATGGGAMDGHMLSLARNVIAEYRPANQNADGGQGDGIGQARRADVQPPRRNMKQRKSQLVNVYRMVLASVSAVDKADILLHTAHTVGFSATEVEVMPRFPLIVGKGKIKEAYTQHLGRRIVQNRDKSIIDGLDLCNHSLSVFEMQDSVQRWFDMCRPFEIKSLSPGQDVDDIDSTQKRYTCILSEILMREPFALLADETAKQRLVHTCIHDFNSAALMMDVCGSLLKIHRVVSDLRKGLLEDSEIKEGLIVFIMQTYASDRAMHKCLKEAMQAVIPPTESTAMLAGLVSTVVGNFRKPARVQAVIDVNLELNLFELSGHYWGSKPADFNTVNHTYFAWPNVERGTYKKLLSLIQNTIHLSFDAGALEHGVLFELFLSSGHKNSLYISSLARSMLAMIDALHCTAILDGTAINVKETSTVHRTKKSVWEGSNAETKALICQYPVFGGMQSPYTFNVSKQTLIDDLRAELSALSSRVERARRGEFKLYTGLSWPVVYGNDMAPDNNHRAFQLAGEMPVVPRTRTEFYLSQMARAAAHASRHMEGSNLRQDSV